jgi:hypothetical protein
MLSFVHKGRTLNLPIDTTSLTGNVQTDSTSSYILSMVGGKVLALGPNGLELADNASGTAALTRPIGFLVNDMAGYFFENKPALASGLAAVAVGTENTIQTDQINTSLTFALGDELYVDTGANAGLITNVKPTNGIAIGRALSTASASSPLLTVQVLLA